ncbi:VOC family protein [Streptomyces sp. NPDC004539]|uniref:VOC family protein n=1 Tax=Streptomyces sp. NPDC004539 TaxID=3154280 RepID=UPI0033B7012A
MPTAALGTVVLDCPDPRTLAGFYAYLLGGTLEGDDDWITLILPTGPALAFQQAPGHTAPAWPSGDHSQQFHLDLTVSDLDTAEKEALALGAKPLDAEDRERGFRVYADPAGHPFCLCRD